MCLKSCCFISSVSGAVPIENRSQFKCKLEKEILDAINGGCKIFHSGLDDEQGLLYAEVIFEMKEKYSDIIFVGAVANAYRFKEEDSSFKKILLACDSITLPTKTEIEDRVFLRDRYMIYSCDRVIATIDDNETFGLRYSRILEKDLHTVTV